MMPNVYPNGEARRKSRFDCNDLPETSKRFHAKNVAGLLKPTGISHEQCQQRVKTLLHFKDWLYVQRYLTCLITLHGSRSMKIYKIGSSTRNFDLIAVKDRFI